MRGDIDQALAVAGHKADSAVARLQKVRDRLKRHGDRLDRAYQLSEAAGLRGRLIDDTLGTGGDLVRVLDMEVGDLQNRIRKGEKNVKEFGEHLKEQAKNMEADLTQAGEGLDRAREKGMNIEVRKRGFSLDQFKERMKDKKDMQEFNRNFVKQLVQGLPPRSDEERKQRLARALEKYGIKPKSDSQANKKSEDDDFSDLEDLFADDKDKKPSNGLSDKQKRDLQAYQDKKKRDQLQKWAADSKKKKQTDSEDGGKTAGGQDGDGDGTGGDDGKEGSGDGNGDGTQTQTGEGDDTSGGGNDGGEGAGQGGESDPELQAQMRAYGDQGAAIQGDREDEVAAGRLADVKVRHLKRRPGSGHLSRTVAGTQKWLKRQYNERIKTRRDLNKHKDDLEKWKRDHPQEQPPKPPEESSKCPPEDRPQDTTECMGECFDGSLTCCNNESLCWPWLPLCNPKGKGGCCRSDYKVLCDDGGCCPDGTTCCEKDGQPACCTQAAKQ